MKNSFLNRRQLLQNAILGGSTLAAAELLGLSGPALRRAANHIQAPHGLPLIYDFSQAISGALRGTSDLLRLQQAYAQAAPKVAFLDCFLGTSADFRYFMNLQGQSFDGSINHGNSTNLGKLSQEAQSTSFKDAKLNRFFEQLCLTGTFDGAPNNGTLPGFQAKISNQTAQAGKIAAYSFVSNQGVGVHQLGAVPGSGNIAYALQANTGMSPMGVAVFKDSNFNYSIQDKDRKVVSQGRSMTELFAASEQGAQTAYVMDEPDITKNLLLEFDAMAQNADIVKIRKQLMDSAAQLKSEIAGWRTNNLTLETGAFNPMGGSTGTVSTRRAAGIFAATDMMKSGLMTVSSIGLNSPDYHQNDGNRAINGDMGSMMSCMTEIGVGVNGFIKSCIDNQIDGVVFIHTCSGRSVDWVQDTNSVFSVMIVVKGGQNAQMAKLKSAAYLPASMNGYLQGSSMDWGAGTMGITAGGVVGQGTVEATILDFLTNAISGKGATLLPTNGTIGKLMST
jgi:hypothetical protein